MGVIDTRVWVPSPAEPVFRYQSSGGVTPRTSVQVTNTTLAELWLNDSPQPPGAIDAAKYVVPAKATAEFPLEASAMTARWPGTINVPGDLVTFVFTDELVSPRVTPGVISTSGAGSPVQSAIAQIGAIGSWPLALTTDSGLNIGTVFMHNNSAVTWRIIISAGGFRTIVIRPYSWVSLPANQPSGSVSVSFLGSLINGLAQNDSMFVAWSDINYVSPLPAGAGLLPNPVTDTAAARVGELTTQQFFHRSLYAGAGSVALRTLGINAGAVQRIVIDSMYCKVETGGLAGASYIQASRGYDGLGGPQIIWAADGVVNGANTFTQSDKEVVICNLNTSFTNVINHIGAGSPANVAAGIKGRILT